MQHNSDLTRYDSTTIALHWLTAALVLLLWLMAQSEALLPREWRHGMWSIHIAAGVGLILVYGVRVRWRVSSGRRLPSINTGVLRIAEQAVHWLLYAVLAVTLVLGVVNVAARGWDLFGLVQIPSFAADDRALRRSINGWHELAANALICLAAFHAVAALWHHYAYKDGVLKRIWFTSGGMSASQRPPGGH
ncbi:cytochrome b [Bosea sp. RAF48]|uniref:cytochrome b n=1 Tax=Bosea sp. RAF48 TaxID=3237480 RepID=UPI003F92F03A